LTKAQDLSFFILGFVTLGSREHFWIRQTVPHVSFGLTPNLLHPALDLLHLALRAISMRQETL
jgi:hypothetical protein